MLLAFSADQFIYAFQRLFGRGAFPPPPPPPPQDVRRLPALLARFPHSGRFWRGYLAHAAPVSRTFLLHPTYTTPTTGVDIDIALQPCWRYKQPGIPASVPRSATGSTSDILPPPLFAMPWLVEGAEGRQKEGPRPCAN